jgi:tellurite resistance protein TerB
MTIYRNLESTNLAAHAAMAKNMEAAVQQAVGLAAAIIATADFNADAKEKDALERALAGQRRIAVLDAREITQAYAKYISEIKANDNLVPENLWQILADLASHAVHGRAVARICFAVFAAYGDMDEQEKSSFVSICQALDIEPKEFGLKL